MLNKAQRKIQRSKNRLSQELAKVLEKVEIDRPLVLKEKARALFRQDSKSEQKSIF